MTSQLVHITETRCGACVLLVPIDEEGEVFACPQNRRLHYLRKRGWREEEGASKMSDKANFRTRPHYGSLITPTAHRVAIGQYEDWFTDTAEKLQYIIDLLNAPSKFETDFGKGRLSLAKELLEVIK